MKIIKKVLLVIGLVLAGLLLYAGVIPGEYRIERSLEIAATPAQIFPHLNSTRLANAWNPFINADPETQVTYAGVESGVGARTSWKSRKMGEGSATIIETVPNERVKVRLDFVKPFAGTQTAEYIIQTVEDRSKVTWAMYGNSKFIERFICIFMNRDKMVGGEFEKGLQALSQRVSATAAL